MSAVTTTSIARQIESLFDGASVAGLNDRQLIERFTSHRDAIGEAAFAALVNRHGPMVMNVCRQVLGAPHDAEDVFQGVFLVLACKARSIRNPDLLASWLYAVAIRTARRARAQIARQRKTNDATEEQESAVGSQSFLDFSVPNPEQALLAREQAEILYGEIDRLSPSFRLPVVLHYFEGLTIEDTAHRLRCPAGTVRSRLARACDKLRRGLNRRGYALSTAAAASALASRSASASVSFGMCETTAQAAMRYAARKAATGTLSASVIAPARDVLRSMLLAKLKLGALALLLLGTIACGAACLIHPLYALAVAREGEPPSEPRRDPARTEARPPEIAQEANKPAPERMFVIGRVLDSQGKPVPNASVLVYARTTAFHILDRPEGLAYPTDIGHAKSDGTGQIRVDVPRTSSSSHDELGVVALAPGHGAGWLTLDTDVEQPVADITLPPEQIIHGRVFELSGQPAGNVRVSVTAIRRIVLPQPQLLPRRSGYDGPRFWWAHPDDLPGWPRTAVSDAEGRFTLHGVGRGLHAYLTVVDPRFATQVVETETDEISSKKPLAIALQPARTLSGRVTYADTGKPVPNVRVGVIGFNQVGLGNLGAPTLFTTTDHEGRYRANPRGGAQGTVHAVAPHGEPYLGASQGIAWPKGAITHSTDVALQRGVLVRGKVTELFSHQPVAGAIVAIRGPSTTDTSVANPPVKTSADGSFVLAARSRRGYIVVNGPTGDYVRRELDEGLFTDGQPGGRRFYYHAFLACDENPGDPDHDVNLTIQACRPIKGQVVGPDGKALTGAWIISGQTFDDSRFPLSQFWNDFYHGVTHNGLFEVHGLAPDAAVSVSFLEPKLKLGATVRVSGKPDTGEPIVVKLAPCGTATARLVGPDGKPLAHFTPLFAVMMVITPGEFSPIKARKESRFMPVAGVPEAIDPVNYPVHPASDGDGRIVFPALIPGTTYHVVDRSTSGARPGMELRKEFTVKAGETLDLGDILIEKPRQ
jgi:RNA polymerase sigma factor (sigma-70 family)